MWHKSHYRAHKNPPMGQTNLGNTLKPNSCQHSCQCALFSPITARSRDIFSSHLQTKYCMYRISFLWVWHGPLNSFSTSTPQYCMSVMHCAAPPYYKISVPPHSFHQQLRTCRQTSRNYKLVIRQLTDVSLPVISASTDYLATKPLGIGPAMLRT
jgi:hypothetical protein